MLKDKVALVTGATRGAGRGIAIELGVAGAIVYCTGRSTKQQPSDMNRSQTIEETAELIERAGGRSSRSRSGPKARHTNRTRMPPDTVKSDY